MVSFFHFIFYTTEKDLSHNQLINIAFGDAMCYFNKKAYGTADLD